MIVEKRGTAKTPSLSLQPSRLAGDLQEIKFPRHSNCQIMVRLTVFSLKPSLKVLLFATIGSVTLQPAGKQIGQFCRGRDLPDRFAKPRWAATEKQLATPRGFGNQTDRRRQRVGTTVGTTAERKTWRRDPGQGRRTVNGRRPRV